MFYELEDLGELETRQIGQLRFIDPDLLERGVSQNGKPDVQISPGRGSLDRLEPVAVLGIKQFVYGVVEDGDPAADRGVAIKRTDRVVVQERGRRPDAHQRGRAIIPPPASGRLATSGRCCR